ncbi:FIG011178: rRNA methylase [uncultured Coleofasciculus sp.]|uniref:FIG011178: rRNA methylase n=1 Tax=uncultured Coleofasciculus sp. TaxID=1267456 RepID=A0A6J4HYU9_9CYAN|nr:FIG011178: rRNA methylase [uncultured Coleofasciculus sp.]
MLTSTQNPLVKEIKKLHQAKGRREQQLFLLEGTHLLEEACAVDYPLVNVCCTPQWQERHQQLWEDAAQRCQRAELVSQEVMQAVATTVQPDGVVATAKRRQIDNSGDLQGALLTSLGLALETVQDPGNLGTIIRAAAAAGAERLWLSADSVDLDNPKVLRSSAGQWFRMPVSVSPDLKAVICQCQAQGTQVVATVPDATLSYWDIDLRRPTLILLGNEAAGLSRDLVSQADTRVQIPLMPGVESLNVAIAAALMLYEAQRQRITNRK